MKCRRPLLGSASRVRSLLRVAGTCAVAFFAMACGQPEIRLDGPCFGAAPVLVRPVPIPIPVLAVGDSLEWTAYENPGWDCPLIAVFAWHAEPAGVVSLRRTSDTTATLTATGPGTASVEVSSADDPPLSLTFSVAVR